MKKLYTILFFVLFAFNNTSGFGQNQVTLNGNITNPCGNDFYNIQGSMNVNLGSFQHHESYIRIKGIDLSTNQAVFGNIYYFTKTVTYLNEIVGTPLNNVNYNFLINKGKYRYKTAQEGNPCGGSMLFCLSAASSSFNELFIQDNNGTISFVIDDKIELVAGAGEKCFLYMGALLPSNCGPFFAPQFFQSPFLTLSIIPTIPTGTNNSRNGIGTVSLSASGSTNATTYRWYSAATGGSVLFSGPTFTTPSLSSTTTYYVSGYNETTGCEGPRTPVTATINIVPSTPISTNTGRCGPGTVTLSATGSTDATTYRWYSSSSGGSVLFSGATFTTPTLSSTTTYYVSGFNETFGSESSRTAVNAVILNIPELPTPNSQQRCGPGTVALSVSGSTNATTYRWYSSATGGSVFNTGSSFTTPSLSATTTYYVSGFNETTGCEGSRTAVTATINPIPSAPNPVQNSVICGPGTVSLSASGSTNATTYRWYSAATGGSVLFSGLNFITPNLTATTAYFVSGYNELTGCEGSRVPVNAVISPVPSATTTTNIIKCGPGTVSLSASGSTNATTYRWYSAATGGSVLSTGSSFTTPSLASTTTYYVSGYNETSGCEGSRTAVTATINPIPDLPQIANQERCGPGTVTLLVINPPVGFTWRWYVTATGGSAISTTNSYTTPSLSATTTYYVSAVNTLGCESGRTAVTATINPIPGTVSASGGERCGTGVVSLSGTVPTNATTIRWYSSATGGSVLSTGLNFTTPSITTTTTYYVSGYNATTGCEGSRTAVIVTINPIPGTVTAANVERCGPGTVSLSAAGSTNATTYRWYSSATGGSVLSTGLNFTTPSITTTTTYYVSGYNETTGCEGSRTAVIATINPIPVAPQIANQERCGSGSVTLLVINPPVGYSFRWYVTATGGSAISTTNTYTTPSLAATTTYYVSAVNNQGCEGSRTVVIATINPIPGEVQSNDAQRCGPGTVTLLASGSSNATTYRWYSSSSGGTPIITNTTFTSPSLTNSRSYWVSGYNAISGCEGLRKEVRVTIDPLLTLPTSSNQERCGPGTVTFTASGSTNSTTYRWYSVATGGTILATSANFTTSNLSNTTNYYVSGYNAITGCESERLQVTAVVNPIPGAVSVDDIVNCGSSDLTLIADGSTNATTYRWYETSTGGTPVFVGSSYSRNFTSSRSLWVSGYNATTGCEGVRERVEILINPIPNEPKLIGASLCQEGNVTLFASGTSQTDTFVWKDSDGFVVNTGISYTKYITETESFFVTVINEFGCESTPVEVIAEINEIPVVPTAPNVERCGPGGITLSAYHVQELNKNVEFKWYSSADLSTRLFTGKQYFTTNLTATKSYWVTATIGICESEAIEVLAVVNPIPDINQVVISGINYCGPSVVTLTIANPNPNYIYNWYSSFNGDLIGTGSTFTSSDIILNDRDYFYSFINQNGCESAKKSVRVNMLPIPSAPVVFGDSVCGNGIMTLSAGGANNGGTYRWYSSESSSDILFEGMNFITPDLSITTSYFVSIVSASGCEGDRSEVQAVVYDVPTAPTSNDVERCGPGTVTLSASGSTNVNTFRWYVSATAPSAIASGVTFNTPSLAATTTYWVSELSLDGCEGVRTEVRAVINPIPVIPVAPNVERCGEGSLTFTATGGIENANYRWYSSATTTEILHEGSSFETPNLTLTRAYYVSAVSQRGCEGVRQEILAVINPIPFDPIVEEGQNCLNGSVKLSATGASIGDIYLWYKNETDSEHFYTGNIFNTPNLEISTSYFVSIRNKFGCESNRVKITAKVYEIPESPKTKANEICYEGTTILTVLEPKNGITYQWYNSENSTVIVGEGAIWKTPYLENSRSYYVAAVSKDGCISKRTEQQIIVRKPKPIIIGEDLRFCINSSEFKFDESFTTKGTFSGKGIVDNIFFPNVAGVGVHLIKYVTKENGCDAFGEIKIEVVNLSQEIQNLNIFNFDICVNDSPVNLFTKFKISQGRWTHENKTINTFDPAKFGVGTHQIGFIVTMDGCQFTKFINVTVNSIATPSIRTLNERIGETAIYEAVLPNGVNTNDYEFEWYINSALVNYGKTFAIANNGDYKLELRSKSKNGCSSEMISRSVSSSSFMKAEFSSSRDKLAIKENGKEIIRIVEGTNLLFYSNLDKNRFKIFWNFGDGFSVENQEPVHYFNKPGTYRVSMKITDTTNGEIYQVEFSKIINVTENSSEATLFDTEEEIEFRVYPNPFSDYLKVRTFVPETGKLSMIIANHAGVILFIKEYSVNVGFHEFEMYNILENRPSGNYILIIQGSGLDKRANIIKD